MSDPTINAIDLKQALNTSNAPTLLDVRRLPTFEAAPSMIPGAQWQDPYLVGQWAQSLPKDRDIVVYCAHGHEIGQGVCSLLTSIVKETGRSVRYLKGGIEAWEQAGGPTTPRAVR